MLETKVYKVWSTFIVAIISILGFLTLDFIITNALDIRGFSKWIQSDSVAGRVNKSNMAGRWGGPLDDFYSSVSIGPNGERNSTKPNCKNIKHRILFLGDSTTAGFEVNDSETFVSQLNEGCNQHKTIGVNLGVRGHDTFSSLGMYQKFSNITAHDKVFYLITSNDFWEITDSNEYKNLTRHFGRLYEGRIIKIQSSWLEKKYLNFRIFVSDNFYFVTKLITFLRILIPSNNEIYASKDFMFTKIRANLPKVVSLLDEFHKKNKNAGVEMIVSIYPCVAHSSESGDPLACRVPEEIDNEFASQLKSVNPNIKFLNANEIIRKYIQRGCFTRESLTFDKDRHFSTNGHYVFSHILRKYILNDITYSKNVLC